MSTKSGHRGWGWMNADNFALSESVKVPAENIVTTQVYHYWSQDK